MKPYTAAERAAMREQWERNRAEREATPTKPITPEEIDRLTDARLTVRKADASRIAANHRRLQAEAAKHGDKGIATTLGMLATIGELNSTLTGAEQRERSVRPALVRDKATQDGRSRGGKSKPAKLPPAAELRAEVAQVQAARSMTEAEAKGIVRQRYGASAQAVNRKLKKDLKPA